MNSRIIESDIDNFNFIKKITKIKISKGEKVIKVKATSKRKAHTRKIKFEGKSEDKKKSIKYLTTTDYKESVKNMDNYISKLNQTDSSKEILESIKNYTSIDYIPINEYMKRGKTIYFNSITTVNEDKTKKIIQNINKFIDESPKFEGEVYRGITYMMGSDKDIKKWDDFINHIENSKTIKFPQFLSCSHSKKVAEIFTNNYQKYSGDFNSCLVEIKTKSGVSIKSISTSNEEELLLSPNNNYKIIKFDKSNSKKIKLYLEEI